MMTKTRAVTVPIEAIEHKILLIRGHKVIIDADLAALYGVTTKRLNEQVKQLLTNCANETERIEMVDMIKHGSVINWQHINLHGEYDFRRRAVNEPAFNMDRILALQVA